MIFFLLLSSFAFGQSVGCDVIWDSPESNDIPYMGGYELELGGDATSSLVLAWDSGWASTSPTVDCASVGAVSGGDYTVRARALHINGVNHSAWSDTVPFALDSGGGVRTLGIPTGLRVVPK